MYVTLYNLCNNSEKICAIIQQMFWNYVPGSVPGIQDAVIEKKKKMKNEEKS